MGHHLLQLCHQQVIPSKKGIERICLGSDHHHRCIILLITLSITRFQTRIFLEKDRLNADSLRLNQKCKRMSNRTKSQGKSHVSLVPHCMLSIT